MTDLVPLDVPMAQLVMGINQEHQEVERCIGDTYTHAIACGEMLKKVKDSLGHGEWGEWVAENFRATDRTASTYMRLYKTHEENQKQVSDSGQTPLAIEGKSIRSAIKLITESSEDKKASKTDAQKKEEAMTKAARAAAKEVPEPPAANPAGNGHIDTQTQIHIPESESSFSPGVSPDPQEPTAQDKYSSVKNTFNKIRLCMEEISQDLDSDATSRALFDGAIISRELASQFQELGEVAQKESEIVDAEVVTA